MQERNRLPEDKFNKKYRRKFEQLIGASRFLTKIWNAYRFLFLNLNKINIDNIEINSEKFSVIDNYFFSEFNKNLDYFTKCFDGYNWHGAMMILRTFFWNEICDNYIEAIKHKFYSDDERTRKNSLKNALNLFYKLLTIISVIMPYISEEIYSFLFKQFINLKSIHLEKWPLHYESISVDSANNGKMIIEIIKFLRMHKSKLQIPLNQSIRKVILVLSINQMKKIDNLKEDIKYTLRIENLDIIEKSQENTIKHKADLKQSIEDLNITVYIFK